MLPALLKRLLITLATTIAVVPQSTLSAPPLPLVCEKVAGLLGEDEVSEKIVCLASALEYSRTKVWEVPIDALAPAFLIGEYARAVDLERVRAEYDPTFFSRIGQALSDVRYGHDLLSSNGQWRPEDSLARMDDAAYFFTGRLYGMMAYLVGNDLSRLGGNFIRELEHLSCQIGTSGHFRELACHESHGKTPALVTMIITAQVPRDPQPFQMTEAQWNQGITLINAKLAGYRRELHETIEHLRYMVANIHFSPSLGEHSYVTKRRLQKSCLDFFTQTAMETTAPLPYPKLN